MWHQRAAKLAAIAGGVAYHLCVSIDNRGLAAINSAIVAASGEKAGVGGMAKTGGGGMKAWARKPASKTAARLIGMA